MGDINKATAKWSAHSAAAGPDYRAGVQGKGPKWQGNAIAAEPLWAARIQEAIAGGWRSAGINAIGATGWEAAAVQKGAPNYETGVRAPISAQKYNANFGPILAAINMAAEALPPRGAPMSPENLARAQAIWAAAHAASGGRSPGQMTMVQPSVTAAAAPTYQYAPAGTAYSAPTQYKRPTY